MKIAMIGAGGWGTAMMISLAGRHKDLVLYCRKPETAEKLNRERENKEYLPGVHLPEVIRITSDLKEAVEGAGCVVICTPSKAVADTAGKIAKWLEKMQSSFLHPRALPMMKATAFPRSLPKRWQGLRTGLLLCPDRTTPKKSAPAFHAQPLLPLKCLRQSRSSRIFS